MQKIVLFCILIEIISELKTTQKFNQHFIFLTGLVISVMILGEILKGIGYNSSFLQENMKNELQKWEDINQNYEINSDLQEKLAKIEQSVEKQQIQQQIDELQEKYQNELCEYGCEIYDVSYNEESDCLVFGVRKKKDGQDNNEIRIAEIGIDSIDEKNQSELEQTVENIIQAKMKEEGVKCRVEIFFTEM